MPFLSALSSFGAKYEGSLEVVNNVATNDRPHQHLSQKTFEQMKLDPGGDEINSP